MGDDLGRRDDPGSWVRVGGHIIPDGEQWTCGVALGFRATPRPRALLEMSDEDRLGHCSEEGGPSRVETAVHAYYDAIVLSAPEGSFLTSTAPIGTCARTRTLSYMLTYIHSPDIHHKLSAQIRRCSSGE